LQATASSGLAVTFRVVSGPATVGGNTLTITGAGTVVVGADQPGNADISSAPEVTRSVVVTPGVATISFSATPNPVFLLNTVTLSAAVSSTVAPPTGSVVFFDNGTQLTTLPLQGGAATFSLSTLTLGTHSLTAVYSGDGNFNAATSAVIAEHVQDFSIAFNGSAQTVIHGNTVTYQLAVASLGGTTMPSAIAFSVTGAPSGSVIEFSPQALNAGSASTTVTFSIKTPDYPTMPTALNHVNRRTGITLAFLLGGCLLIPLRRRARASGSRWILTSLLLALSAVGMTAIIGCSGGWNSGNYAIVVTAVSGPLAHPANTILTVK
jgi:hypothetical protein